MLSKLEQQNRHWFGEKMNLPPQKRDAFETVQNFSQAKPIVYLTGPRRVGKSVLLHQSIESLLQSGVPARQILFFEFSSRDSLDDLDLVYQTFKTNVADSSQQMHVFFDEIQYIEGYEVKIKLLYDLENHLKLFLTGSLSLSYKKRMEDSLAGRFFHLNLRPLHFSEYLRLTDETKYELLKITQKEEDPFKKQGGVLALNPIFKTFLERGRYPETAFLKPELVPYYMESLLGQVFHQDVIDFFEIEKPNLMRALFQFFTEHNGAEVNIARLSQITGVHALTVKRYLDVLDVLGMLTLLEKKRSPLKLEHAHQKAYINSMFSLGPKFKNLNYGHAVESYLLDRFLEQGIQVTFYRERNREVDFISFEEKNAYELKFRTQIPPKSLDFLKQLSSKLGLKPHCFSLDQVGMHEGVVFLPACLF